MNSWLIVLIAVLVISLINTILVLLTDYNKMDDFTAMSIMCGVVGWILIFIGFIIEKIKRLKFKNRKNK